MDTVAFALREELQGTVSQQVDGAATEIPTFQGAVLAIGDGDLHVADALHAGNGAIVVQANDAAVIDLLDAYPPVERVTVPAGATAISPYPRKAPEVLAHLASLRDFEDADVVTVEDAAKVAARLDAHDHALDAADQPLANAIAAGDSGAVKEAADDAGSDGLDGETVADLKAIAEVEGVTYSEKDKKDEIIAKLRAAGVQSED